MRIRSLKVTMEFLVKGLDPTRDWNHQTIKSQLWRPTQGMATSASLDLDTFALARLHATL